MTPASVETADEVKARGRSIRRPRSPFIAQWAIRSTDARTLEPACGDGSFLRGLPQAVLLSPDESA